MKKKILSVILVIGMITAFTGCSSKTGVESTVAQADENGNYVVNGGFEEADFTGWTVTNVDNATEELDIYTRDTDCYEGVQSLHFYSGTNEVNFTAEQTISGLEAGTYKLTGHIQGDSTEYSVVFYAVIDGQEYDIDGFLNGYVNWYTAELSGLNVANGEIVIGVKVTSAPGGWGTIDDITLIKE